MNKEVIDLTHDDSQRPDGQPPRIQPAASQPSPLETIDDDDNLGVRLAAVIAPDVNDGGFSQVNDGGFSQLHDGHNFLQDDVYDLPAPDVNGVSQTASPATTFCGEDELSDAYLSGLLLYDPYKCVQDSYEDLDPGVFVHAVDRLTSETQASAELLDATPSSAPVPVSIQVPASLITSQSPPRAEPNGFASTIIKTPDVKAKPALEITPTVVSGTQKRQYKDDVSEDADSAVPVPSAKRLKKQDSVRTIYTGMVVRA